MARLENLEFVISASTTELRSQLNAGSAVIDKFARDTESRFSGLDRGFATLGRTLRSTLGLFGVGFGATMFARWTSGAVEAAGKTSEAAKAIRDLKDAWNDLGAAIGNSDTYQRIARGLGVMVNAGRETILPTAVESAQADVDRLSAQVTPRGSSRDRAEAERQARLRAELADARARLIVATRDQFNKSAREIKDLSVSTDFGKLPAGMAQFDFAGAIRDVQQSAIQEITPADLVSKRPAGMLSFNYDKAIAQVKEFNKGLEESDKRAKAFADSFASAFESRGIEALLDGDISGAIKGLAKDFAELVIRLAVLRPLAESMASSLTGVGLGSLLGFASGGRPPMGMASVVGENGPELFVPDVPGRILSNAQSRAALSGGGDTFSPIINVQAGLPPQWEAQLAGVGQMTANAVYEAVTTRLGNRR